MATYEYVIKSGCTSTSYDHYHSANISDINSALNSNLPKNAYISSAKVYLEMYHKTVLGTIGNGDINIWFSNEGDSNSGTKLYSGKTSTSTQYINNIDISGYLSSRYSTFTLSTPYPKISVYYDSTTRREYHCNSFKIIFEWYIPTYTITVNAGTGGTVSGGGTFENGTTTTITATANKGYTFKQWNDGNTNASRSVTVNSNVTYTAEFAPIEFNITVECVESDSGEKCTVSGGGTYKFGDTITLTATNIPPYHRFERWRGWEINTSYYTPTVSITIDESFFDALGNPMDVTFLCYLEHTGFRLYANVSPDSSVGTVDYGFYLTDYEYMNIGPVVAEGRLFTYTDSDYIGIKAQPSTGYKFVKWQDGNTDNPRRLHLTGDVTYTAIFEKITFTVTYRNDDGTVLQTSIVEYGAKNPPYTGDEPMKESTVQYHFDFLGWDHEVYYITQDVVYTAVYQKSIRGYDIIVISLPNETNRKTIYPMEMYGSTVTITAKHDDGYEFVRWEDGVTTQTREVVVTGEATYIAYFRVNSILGNKSKVVELKLNFDEVEGLLLNHTKIYEKGN